MRAAKKPKDLREKKERSLYISLPTRIKSKEQVERLLFGDFKVTLTRQTSRHCYVLFSSVEEKLKNLKALKNKTINGKRIIVRPVATSTEKSSKVPKKKIVLPKIQEDSKVTQTLFVANIKCGTSIQEMKEAFEGCVSAKLLKPYTQSLRSAIIKLETIQMAAEYLSRERQWPTVRGNKLILKPDTRKKHKTKKSKAENKIITERPNFHEPNISFDTSDRSDSDVENSSDQLKERCVTSTNWQISGIHFVND